MSRRILIVAAGLAASLFRDGDVLDGSLARLADALRDTAPAFDFPTGPEPFAYQAPWVAEPVPPFLQRAALDHHAPRPRQAPSSYG